MGNKLFAMNGNAGEAEADCAGNVVRFPRESYALPAAPAVDPAAMQMIVKLRLLLCQSLLRPRKNFDHACMLISADENITMERYASAFFQGMELFGLRQLCFYPVSSIAVSDDEMWLARLLISLDKGDYTSARYLIALRAKSQGHRRLLFLAQGLAALMSASGADHE